MQEMFGMIMAEGFLLKHRGLVRRYQTKSICEICTSGEGFNNTASDRVWNIYKTQKRVMQAEVLLKRAGASLTLEQAVVLILLFYKVRFAILDTGALGRWA